MGFKPTIKKMSQYHMVGLIEAETRLPRNVIEDVLAAFFRHASRCLVDGLAVVLPYIGTLAPRLMKERELYVPHRGGRFRIPSQIRIRFRQSNFIRPRLNPDLPPDAFSGELINEQQAGSRVN